MQDEERSCALRALTLCDGQVVTRLDGRGDGCCWCVALEEATAAGWDAIASSVRHERARVVARSDELLRLREQRSRFLSAPDF